MSRELIEKYRALAQSIQSPKPSLPVPQHVFFGEAADAAGFARTYWAPKFGAGGKVLRRGLSQANNEELERIPEDIADQLDELLSASVTANQQYKLTTHLVSDDPMERAEAILEELRAALEFLFDDEEETPEDLALQELSVTHGNPTSQDAMALALDDYAALAEPQRTVLQGLGDFDVDTIELGRRLAIELRERSAPDGDASNQARRLRDQLYTLLGQRVNLVRKVAAYVFRDQPEIVRLASSGYQRRRRASRRSKQQQTEPGAAATSVGAQG